jgi:hypothetical protein
MEKGCRQFKILPIILVCTYEAVQELNSLLYYLYQETYVVEFNGKRNKEANFPADI